MSFLDALNVFVNTIALSAAIGLIFVMVIQPRRQPINNWFGLVLVFLVGWAFFSIARIRPDLSPLDETQNFYAMFTGLALTPLAWWLFVSALCQPRSYWEPPLRIGAVVLTGVFLLLLWSDQLADYTPTGGDDLDVSINLGGMALLIVAVGYSARAYQHLHQHGERSLQAAGLLVIASVVAGLITPLLELPLSTGLATVALLLVGYYLLRQQLFAPLAQANIHIEQLSTDLRANTNDLTGARTQAQQLQNQLREAIDGRSEFLNNMGHELRTPLNSIVGYSELMLKGIYGDLTDKQTDRIDKIYTNSLDLLDLINDIMDFSRIEGGRMELNLSDVRVGPLLETVFKSVEERLEGEEVELRLDLAEPLRLIRADELRIRHVLLHLLNNAIKYTEKGHVQLSARSVTVRQGRSDDFSLPVLGWLSDRHWLIISVEDTGVGIPPEEQAVIFEAFRQGGPRGEKGAGMGLAIASKLAEIHTGRIWVNSQPGQGSTFYLALPALDEFDMAEATTEYNVELLNVDAIVLLIEDDDERAALIEPQLQAANYLVVRSSDGPTGLARAHEIRPATIVIDMLMADLGGWDALRRLKHDPATADIPIVLTGVVGGEPRGFVLGASAGLYTPVQRDELVATLGHIQHEHLDEPVLVVDNDAADRATLQEVLTGENMPVAMCKSGQAALDWLAEPGNTPGLVLLDVNMPKVSGFQVLHRLRSEKRLAQVPIVLTYTEEFSAAEQTSLRDGINQVIAQGSQLDDLVACVAAALDTPA